MISKLKFMNDIKILKYLLMVNVRYTKPNIGSVLNHKIIPQTLAYIEAKAM